MHQVEHILMNINLYNNELILEASYLKNILLV